MVLEEETSTFEGFPHFLDYNRAIRKAIKVTKKIEEEPLDLSLPCCCEKEPSFQEITRILVAY